MNRLLILLAAWICGLAFAGLTGQTQAEDVLVLRSSSGKTSTEVSGEILDLTGTEVQFSRALPGGTSRQEIIPRDRVAAFRTAWPRSYREAEAQFAQHRYQDAVPLYRAAMTEDARTWARREILSRLVQCYRNLGEIQKAGENFQLIYLSDPTTDLDVLPLSWKPGRVPPTLEQRALGWLQSDAGEAIRLMGASWLLTGSQRARAEQTLQQLLTASDPRVVMLANTQLWRTKIVQVDAGQLARWQQQLEVMPHTLRSGPYFLLGHALARQNRFDEASLAWMRVPIHTPHRRELAAESLLAAASALENLGQREESISLLRELALDYSEIPLATQAARRLTELESRASADDSTQANP